jgi:hypothetical protein
MKYFKNYVKNERFTPATHRTTSTQEGGIQDDEIDQFFASRVIVSNF